MRQALLGNSGTLIGLDYRGETVLAAFEPVAVLNLGVVAKIDLWEIRAPFIRTGIITGILALFAIMAGAFMFVHTTNPMFRRIQESEAKHRMLVETALDGIFVTNDQGYYVDANPMACKMSGYERDELLGLHVLDLVGKDEVEKTKAGFRQLISKGSLFVEFQQFKRKDGSFFPAELNAVAMDDGRVQGILRDISERKRVESELRDALFRLKAAQTLSELQASRIARIHAYHDFVHTIGNIVTPVRVKLSSLIKDKQVDRYLEQLGDRVRLLQEKQAAGELGSYLAGEGREDLPRFLLGLDRLKERQEIAAEGLQVFETALNKIVETTSAQSHLQKELTGAEELDLVAVVQAVLNLMENTWRGKGIDWRFNVDGDGGQPQTVSIKVEKVRLFDMIHNVMKNAGEALSDPEQQDKRIGIHLHTTEEGVVLEIDDNGQGLSTEESALVGQLGFTTKYDPESGEGGSGMGIHLCQIFMAQLGGKFELTSRGQGQGVRATMNFPKGVIV